MRVNMKYIRKIKYKKRKKNQSMCLLYTINQSNTYIDCEEFLGRDSDG